MRYAANCVFAKLISQQASNWLKKKCPTSASPVGHSKVSSMTIEKLRGKGTITSSGMTIFWQIWHRSEICRFYPATIILCRQGQGRQQTEHVVKRKGSDWVFFVCTEHGMEGCVCSKQWEIGLGDPALLLRETKGTRENEKGLGLWCRHQPKTTSSQRAAEQTWTAFSYTSDLRQYCQSLARMKSNHPALYTCRRCELNV